MSNPKRKGLTGVVQDTPSVQRSMAGNPYARFVVQLDDGELLACVCFDRAAERFEESLIAKGDRLSLAGRRKGEGEMVVDFFVLEGAASSEAVAAQAENDKRLQEATRAYVKKQLAEGKVLARREDVHQFMHPDDVIEVDGAYVAKLTFVMDRLGGGYVTQFLREKLGITKEQTVKKLIAPKKGFRAQYLELLQQLLDEALFGKTDDAAAESRMADVVAAADRAEVSLQEF